MNAMVVYDAISHNNKNYWVIFINKDSAYYIKQQNQLDDNRRKNFKCRNNNIFKFKGSM